MQVSAMSDRLTSALLGLPEDLVNLNDGALAGRADLRDSQPLELLRLGQVGRVWHPSASLQGYHTPARGQSHARHAPVPSRAAPGPPRGRAPPGRRDATRSPVSKMVGDHAELMTVWTLYGHKPPAR